MSQLESSESLPKQVRHWLRSDKEKGVWTLGNSLRRTYYFLKGTRRLWLHFRCGRAKTLNSWGRGLKMVEECWDLGLLSGAPVLPGVPLERAFV